MELLIEAVDMEGRAIFFQSFADISELVKFESYDLSTPDRVNNLYNEKRLPDPKFHGFVYNYSSYLSLHYYSGSKRHKLKRKIDYKAIQATYPCEHDPNLVIMVISSQKVRNQILVLRLPTPLAGTKLRYVIDQLQLNPIHRSANFKNGSVHTTMNSSSSFSTPMAEESDGSITSASHCVYRNAAQNPTMQVFNEKEEEEQKLPRVQPFAFSSMTHSSPYHPQRLVNQLKGEIFDNFNPANYEIYRPVSRKSRDDRYAYDYGEFRSSSRRRASRPRLESSGYNHNSRAAMRNRSLVYLDPECEDYRGNRYEHDVQQRLAFDRLSSSRLASRRYDHY